MVTEVQDCTANGLYLTDNFSDVTARCQREKTVNYIYLTYSRKYEWTFRLNIYSKSPLQYLLKHRGLSNTSIFNAVQFSVKKKWEIGWSEWN